ncbi:MAG: metal-dependent hydrolase [Promethearchaeota archaeon]
MDIFTHFILGMLLAGRFLGAWGTSFVLYAGVMSVLVDFDFVFTWPARKLRPAWDTPALAHKGASHSLVLAVPVTAATGGLYSVFFGGSFALAWGVGYLFYALHLGLDALAASKVPLLYPLSGKRFRFFVDRAINPLLASVSGGLLFVFLLAYFLAPALYNYTTAHVLLAAYATYFSFRVAVKLAVSSRLSPGQSFVPGVSPLGYLVHEEVRSGDATTYRLVGKDLLHPGRGVVHLESVVRDGSSGWRALRSAVSAAASYPFFHKWDALVPVVLADRVGDQCLVRLFFGEGFAAGRCYAIEVAVDPRSGEVLSSREVWGAPIPSREVGDGN